MANAAAAAALRATSTAPLKVVQGLGPLLTSATRPTTALVAPSAPTNGLINGLVAALTPAVLAAPTPALLAATTPALLAAPTPALLAAYAATKGLIKGHLSAPSLGLLAASAPTKGLVAAPTPALLAASAATKGHLAAPSLGLLAADVRQPAAVKLGHGLLTANTVCASRGRLLSARSYAYLATGGRRSMATGPSFSPELMTELQKMNAASLERHQTVIREIRDLEHESLDKYSAGRLASAEHALSAGKIAWRVTSLVLLFGTTTLVTVLQCIKTGWEQDFEKTVKIMLEEMIDSVKADLLTQLRKVARQEIALVEAEKAARK